MLMTRIVAILLASVTSSAAQTGLIAGYYAQTNVNDYLNKDLIQNQLESLMIDEECPSFQNGRAFYNGILDPGGFPDGGQYLKDIPTYGLNIGEVKSAEYKEYIKWAGNKNDFHLKWVRKAFDKLPLPTNYGEMKADFTDGVTFPGDYIKVEESEGECVGFEECVKKATSYVFNFIEVVQLMQAAIESAKGGCIYQQDDCETALGYWDAAAAIYVGSLEGPKGRLFAGKSNYALANKRCRNFKQCGPQRNEGASKKRTAPINTLIMAYFAAGQQATFAGDYALMEDFKKLISAKMAVPWIQGTLRYAHRLSGERTRAGLAETSSIDPLDNQSNIRPFSDDPDLKDPLENGFINPLSPTEDYSTYDKEVGEAAAFALGAVPKLWACSTNAAEYVWPQLAPGVGVAGFAPVNFQLVKLAFECNYKCLLTSCTEVGSLYDGVDNDVEPIDETLSEDEQNAQKDANADIRPGAKTCNDAQFGYDPKGYSKCTNIPGNIRNGKCKFLRGRPGIIGRDKLKYFQKTLP